MLQPLLQRASLALLPLAVFAPAAVDAPAYAPAQDTTLVRTFTLTIDTTMDESEMLINGSDEMSPQIESDSNVVRSLKVTDRISSAKDGRPLALERTFDTVALAIESPVKLSMIGQDTEADMVFEGASDLEARGVQFTWDSDDSAYVKAWSDEDDAGNAELLEGIVEDLDLRALLPSGDVEVGDSWEVDPAAMVDVLFASGDLAFELTSTGDEPPAAMGDVTDQPSIREGWLNLGESSVSAQLAEPETEGDRRIAVIELELELTSTTNDAETVREGIESQVPGADVNIEFATTKNFLEGKGVLKWDMAAGHAVSLSFRGDISSEQAQAANISIGGQELAVEGTTSNSGTLTLEVTIAAQ